MGKKGKDKKKGKGAEKTATKTDKKQAAKQKKLIAKIGEADIEQIISQFEEVESKRMTITESIVPAPSARVNFSICAHPADNKEELVIFGGEYFNGQKTTIFNDLFFYNIPKNEWKQVHSPAGPTPRSGHQMVAAPMDGGQIWLFGGEYASPSQLQFYHYKDLWVFRMNTKKWEKINSVGAPSARSGHRMILMKKKIFVFGGFHDNNQSYKYFNDVYSFSLEDYTWQKIEAGGALQPAPRSGCCMAPTADGKILIWGGYSRSAVKKEIDRGVVHADMFSLVQDKNTLAWKWITVKPSGMRPLPRSGMSCSVALNGKAYAFGGILDTEEDEESLQGQLSNDLHALELTNQTWRKIELPGKKKKKKEKTDENDDEDDVMETEVPKTTTDGIFTMSVGGSMFGTASTVKAKPNIGNSPAPRMNTGMVVCKGNLYVFGGVVEEGSKQFTLCDLHSLDLSKMDIWKTIIPNTVSSSDWMGSDSESDSDDSDDDDESDDDDDDDEDDDSSEMDTD